MVKINLKSALGDILDKAYANEPLAEAASDMSDLSSKSLTSPALKLTITENKTDEQLQNAANNHPSIHQMISKPEPTIHPSNQSSPGAVHPFIRPIIHSSNHSPIHPSVHLFNEKSKYHPLTPGHGKVLMFLIEKCVGATNVETISNATQVPVGTVKDGLRALLKYGYVSAKWRIVQYDFHGFGYSLNHQICIEYSEKVNGTTQSSIYPSIHPIIQPSGSLSSSSSYKKTTPEKPQIDLDHPELDYWIEQGLNAKTVTGWMEEFAISDKQILQALKHAAFDIPLQEEKRGERIDPFNWFYAGLKRFGTYRRPAGYKPLEQILLCEARIEREEREKMALELAEERQRGEKSKHELKFQQIMANPTGCEYQRLKAQVVVPGGLLLSGKMLEVSMREAFLNEQKGE